jgi:esterase/lipase superfamily enzyme
MVREYRKNHSSRLGREMELLVFGHSGQPVVVFPTSGGRFYEFEDRGMIEVLTAKIDAGLLQLWCVDSVDLESWYNRHVTPRERVARHLQYEDYLIHELAPVILQQANEKGTAHSGLLALGCSFGGYHAANIAFRHPDVFTGMLSLSGIFDLSKFLDSYQDESSYLNLPTYYLPNLNDPWFLERLRSNRFVLATGWDDQCLRQNQDLDRILNEKAIPHQLHVWNDQNAHDWPTWRRMVAEYL